MESNSTTENFVYCKSSKPNTYYIIRANGEEIEIRIKGNQINSFRKLTDEEVEFARNYIIEDGFVTSIID